jgi:hypothetical protein
VTGCLPLLFRNYVRDYGEEHGDGYCRATSYEKENVTEPENADVQCISEMTCDNFISVLSHFENADSGKRFRS